MVNQSRLNPRHQDILKATIKHYIATAEPVASKTLAQKYDFNVSSATIRNVMGSLESAGLLYQPHPSAGRVPSDSGYRTYVDHLLVPNDNIDQGVQKIVQQELQIARNFETLLQRAAKILATLSGYIALVTFPQKLNSTLSHLQLVGVAAHQVMLIVVTDSYQTQSILMESPLAKEEVDESTISHKLQLLSNFLDSQLKGCCLSDLTTIKWTNLDNEFAQYSDFLQLLLEQLKLTLQSTSSSPMVIHGVAEFLRQPEFSQLQQVQTLLSLLEEQQEQLSPIIFTNGHPHALSLRGRERVTFPELESLQRVSIKIGRENSLEPMQTCTLVSANYYQDQVPVGSVGILGPKRMLYENAIALVKNTADYLSNPFQAFAVTP